MVREAEWLLVDKIYLMDKVSDFSTVHLISGKDCLILFNNM